MRRVEQRRFRSASSPISIWLRYAAKTLRISLEREKEGVKPNTIRLDLAILSKLFEVARNKWGMESLSNPVKTTEKPKLAGSERTRRLQPAPRNEEDAKSEEKRLIEAAGDKFKPVIQFALATAMRRTEIAELRWENVNLKGKTAYLEQTKNMSERTVPLWPSLQAPQQTPLPHSKQPFPFQHGIVTPLTIRSNQKSRRKSNGGTQPSTFTVGRQNAAPVRVDGPLGDGQAEACSMARIVVEPEKRIEYPL